MGCAREAGLFSDQSSFMGNSPAPCSFVTPGCCRHELSLLVFLFFSTQMGAMRCQAGQYSSVMLAFKTHAQQTITALSFSEKTVNRSPTLTEAL